MIISVLDLALGILFAIDYDTLTVSCFLANTSIRASMLAKCKTVPS